jgi:hypothetical protein
MNTTKLPSDRCDGAALQICGSLTSLDGCHSLSLRIKAEYISEWHTFFGETRAAFLPICCHGPPCLIVTLASLFADCGSTFFFHHQCRHSLHLCQAFVTNPVLASCGFPRPRNAHLDARPSRRAWDLLSFVGYFLDPHVHLLEVPNQAVLALRRKSTSGGGASVH